MKLIFTLLLLLFYHCTLFSQDLLPSSVRAPITNENGDPLTNILDQNGVQQGEWFYTDFYNNDLLRKKYVNNICTDIHYFHNGLWVNAKDWEQNLSLITELKVAIKAHLSKHQMTLTLNSNQQIALLYDSLGNLSRYAPIGEWDSKKAKQLELQVKNILEKINSNNIQNDTFILF